MSSLLSELALDYEILADDPIEMGIHYGQSILSQMSDSWDTVSAYSRQVAREISTEVVSLSARATSFVTAPKVYVERKAVNSEQVERPGFSRSVVTERNKPVRATYTSRSAVDSIRPRSRGNVQMGYRRRGYLNRAALVH